MKKEILKIIGLAALSFAVGCTPSATSMKKLVEDNPDILFGAIEKNPKKFFDVVMKAQREAQSGQQEDERKAEETRMENEFKNPKIPDVSQNRPIFGNKTAPITIVEYSDLE